MSEQMICYNVKNGRQMRKVDVQHMDAVISVTDNVGDSLFHVVFQEEEPNQAQIIKVFEILLNRGLDINMKHTDEKTVLQWAVARCLRDVIDFCIRRNADLSYTDYSGNTLGHFVVKEACRKYNRLIARNENIAEMENESSNFVAWMVSRGIDFFQKKNKNNQSAFYLAIQLNLQPIVLTLLKLITDFHSIENDQKPLICYFLKMNYSARRVTNSHADKYLKPIHSKNYLERHFCNILQIILERNQFMSNDTLNSALRTVIYNGEPLVVIDLILDHTRSVRRNRRADGDSLLQIFTNQYHILSHIPEKIEHVMKILKKLVDKGGDINEPRENEGTIAMEWFLEHPKLEMLRLLQDCGADFSARRENNDNFLHIIGRYGNEIGMAEIARKGCDVNAVNSEGQTPLTIAIAHGNNLVAMDLLDFGARFNDRFDGRSALSSACLEGRAEVVEKMIKCGADFRYRNDFEKTLLHLALNSQKTVAVLLENGVDVNAKDKEGQTPLHLAKHVSVIETLINAGAFIDMTDNEGRTPLYHAIFKKDRNIIVELLKAGADVRDAKVFQRAIEFFRYEPSYMRDSSMYLQYHVLKMSALGLAKGIFYADKNRNPVLHFYFSMYQEEVKLLKEFVVDDCTSLYQLLRRNQNRRCAFVNNMKLKSLVADPTIVKQFRYYFVFIIGCYNEARTRKPLLEEAPCILRKIAKVSLPDLCVDEILTYLSNIDLVRFIEACKML